MKTIVPIALIIIAVMTTSPSSAGSVYEQTTDQPSSGSHFWQKVKTDWQKIGKSVKDSGAEIGQGLKKEFQEMPENFRKGYAAAKEDLKNGTVSPREPRTEN